MAIDKQYLGRARTHQPHNLNLVVGLSYGRDDIWIAHTGISSDASILHAIAADE